MSAVTMGPHKYFNGTASTNEITLTLSGSYNSIFNIGYNTEEVVISTLDGNALRVSFDDSTAMAAGNYFVVPGNQIIRFRAGVKNTIHLKRNGSSDAIYSICCVGRNRLS